MIMDIGTEEISHVEMLTVMLARLLEGAPGEVTSKAVATNPVLAAVIGGQNPQHAIVSGGNAMPTNSQGVPWNTGYIVASGNLLTDFRSNAAAEGQSRLMTSRIANMTDDRGVKDMLAFNLARDTYHQQQWLLGIEQLQADGFTDGVIENSNGEWEDKSAAHVFYTSTPGSRAGEGLWATGTSMLDGEPFRVEPLEPLTDDQGILPPPDPKQFVTYDGSQGPGKPGDAKGAHAQGAQNVVGKIKDALTPDD
jgi:Mn-containing catalase